MSLRCDVTCLWELKHFHFHLSGNQQRPEPEARRAEGKTCASETRAVLCAVYSSNRSLCHHFVLKNAGDYKNAASQPVKVCIRFSLTESEVERLPPFCVDICLKTSFYINAQQK